MKKRLWFLLIIPFLFVVASCSFLSSNGDNTNLNVKTKLSTPSIKLDGKKIVIEGVENATSYDIYTNDKFYKNSTTLTYSLTQLSVGEYVWLPEIRKAVKNGETEIMATVIGVDGSIREMKLELKDVTESEKKILLAGSMINSYREDLGLN